MKIGMVLDNTFPPDSRVENEAVSLLAAGHEVFLFCLKRGDDKPEEVINGIEVRRFETNSLEYKLSALAYTVPFYHNLMEPKIRRFIKTVKPDILHVHDIAVARAAFQAAEKYKLPVVLDLHENRPVIMKEYVHLKKWPGKWLISPSVWDRYQEKYCRMADRLIVVTDEAAEDLSHAYQIQSDKFTVVPNTVSPELYMQYKIDDALVQKFRNGYNILYMGDTGLRRGTDTVIKAMPAVLRDIPEARLILVGSNTEDVQLKALVRQLDIAEHVTFEGWQDVSLFPSYVAASQVCVSPLKRNRHHDTTFANKIFQYMAGGKPLVVSDCPPQKRVVEESRCGLVHKADDPAGLADCIIRLYKNPKLASDMGKHAKDEVMTTWNWEVTSRAMLKMYSALAANSS